MDPSPALSFAVDVKPRALAFAKLFACIAVAVITYQYILLGFLWIRARYMLRKLPRPAEDATILGFPKKFASPQRHIATLGACWYEAGCSLCRAGWYSHMWRDGVAEMTKLGPIVYLRVLKTQASFQSEPTGLLGRAFVVCLYFRCTTCTHRICWQYGDLSPMKSQVACASECKVDVRGKSMKGNVYGNSMKVDV